MGFLLNLLTRLTIPAAASTTAAPARSASTTDEDASGGSFRVLMRIVRMALDYPGLLLIGLVFIIGASVFQLFIPLLIGDGVDTVEEAFTSLKPTPTLFAELLSQSLSSSSVPQYCAAYSPSGTCTSAKTSRNASAIASG